MSHRVSSFEWLYSRTHQGNRNGAFQCNIQVELHCTCARPEKGSFSLPLAASQSLWGFSHWGCHRIGNECGVKHQFSQTCYSHQLSFFLGQSLQISDRQATLRFPGTHKCPLSRSLLAPSLQFIPADFLLPCRCTLPLEMNWYPQGMSLKRDPENCEVGEVNSHLHFKVTVLTGPLEGPLQWNCKNWCEVEVHSYPLVQVV